VDAVEVQTGNCTCCQPVAEPGAVSFAGGQDVCWLDPSSTPPWLLGFCLGAVVSLQCMVKAVMHFSVKTVWGNAVATTEI